MSDPELSELNPGPDESLRALVEGLIDGTLSVDEQEQLEARLRDDSSAVDYCAERFALHGELEEITDPLRFELVQSRRVLIEGRGRGRTVTVGQSHAAQIGRGDGAAAFGVPVLPGPAAPQQRWWWAVPILLVGLLVGSLFTFWLRPRDELHGGGVAASAFRKPLSDKDLRGWLQNMVWYHNYDLNEIRSATGLGKEEIEGALERFDITADGAPVRSDDAPLLTLPYPGGRHTRNGDQNRAIDPQRDTKISVFAPWDEGYVVLDLPEAMHVNGILYYLAHTDEPTIWTTQGMALKPQEWTRNGDGSFESERILPNGLTFGFNVMPGKDAVRQELWLRNDTPAAVTEVTFQTCVLLAKAKGFRGKTKGNKYYINGYSVCHNIAKNRWVISAWDQSYRFWALKKSPCMHSDPKISVCRPGETVRLAGWLSFYEGRDIKAELARIEATGWRDEVKP